MTMIPEVPRGAMDTAVFTNQEGTLMRLGEELARESDLSLECLLAMAGCSRATDRLVAAARVCGLDAHPDNIFALIDSATALYLVHGFNYSKHEY